MAYATVDELVQRWRPLSPDERARAEQLLADAAVRIDIAAPPPSPLTEQAEAARRIVSCDMVKRAMLTPIDQPAATQTQNTAGPFMQGVSYANPTGDLYLAKADRILLGLKRQRAGSVDLLPSGPA